MLSSFRRILVAGIYIARLLSTNCVSLIRKLVSVFSSRGEASAKSDSKQQPLPAGAWYSDALRADIKVRQLQVAKYPLKLLSISLTNILFQEVSSTSGYTILVPEQLFKLPLYLFSTTELPYRDAPGPRLHYPPPQVWLQLHVKASRTNYSIGRKGENSQFEVFKICNSWSEAEFGAAGNTNI